MKISTGIKIALLVSSFLISGFLLFAIYSVLKAERFEYSMLILFAVNFTGFFSVIYHIKTLTYYKLDIINVKPEVKIFWVGNLLFSIALFCLSLYSLYILYTVFYRMDGVFGKHYLLPIGICIYTLLVGVFLAIEASVFYKRNKRLDEKKIFDSIEDIKGNSEEDWVFFGFAALIYLVFERFSLLLKLFLWII